MRLSEALPPPAKIPAVTDRTSLKEALCAWTTAHANILPVPIVQLSRLYNRSATRFETSVLELLHELHTEDRLLLFNYGKSNAHYVLSEAQAKGLIEVIREEVTEGGKPFEEWRFQDAYAARLQLMASHYVASKE